MARRADKQEVKATQHASGEARTLAETLPRLILEARKIAATVIHGLHGRRRAGPGENFWQYRRFLSGEPARRVDWRRSARDGILYVREQEWEAAHTVWIWPDRSPSMQFTSQLASESKLNRALVIAFALAEVLVHAGERVGVPGLMRPTGSRNVLDKMANAVVHDVTERASLPPSFVPSALSEIVLVSDFWSPISEIRTTLSRLSATGAHGHTVQVVDPAEETFPYSGRVEFIEPEGAGSITANYDGANKHRTVIGADVHVGSNCVLVAPVTVGDGATIGAGSTVGKPAPAGQLTVARARQVSISGWTRPVKKKP